MFPLAYCDYTFYRDVYLGNRVPEQDFQRLAEQAGQYLLGLTAGRTDLAAGEDLDRVKRASCNLAEVLLDEERACGVPNGPGGALSGETVGDWSVRYAQPDGALLTLLDRRKEAAARLWLDGAPLFAPVFRARSWPCIPPIR